MVEQAELYALNVAQPWEIFPDLGVHRIADGTMDGDRQKDAEVVFNAKALAIGERTSGTVFKISRIVGNTVVDLLITSKRGSASW